MKTQFLFISQTLVWILREKCSLVQALDIQTKILGARIFKYVMILGTSNVHNLAMQLRQTNFDDKTMIYIEFYTWKAS